MMKCGILHPDLLAGLARCGHGSRVLVADALFPHATGCLPGVPRVYLNLCPGTVPARQVVQLISGACTVEAATFMQSPDGESEAVAQFRADLRNHRHWGGQELLWDGLERDAFYQVCREPDVALMVASGEVRPYSNLLLTVGVT